MDLGIKEDFLSNGRFLIDFDPQNKKKMDQPINETLAADYVTFSTVNSPRFQHFLAIVEFRNKI